MCSMVASSPIVAVQLAERALTASNYSQNHLLALSVDVILGASAGNEVRICQSISAKLLSSPFCPEQFRAKFLPHCSTGGGRSCSAVGQQPVGQQPVATNSSVSANARSATASHTSHRQLRKSGMAYFIQG